MSLGDTTVDNFGRILKGKITINLTEFAEEASSKKATAGSSNGQLVPGRSLHRASARA